MPTSRTRHHGCVAQTGRGLAKALTTQPRDEREEELIKALMAKVGQGTTATRDWDDPWYCCDYSADRTELNQLRKYQSDLHGSFDMRGLMAAPVFGESILINTEGGPLTAKEYATITRRSDTLGDVIEIERADSCRVRFKSKRLEYPLPPMAAHAFRKLCDTVVYNYPAALAPRTRTT
jgi:hypothetical protein